MNKEEIMKIIQKHYDTICNNEYEVVGVFLTGSQNYGIDTEESDVDTKAIIIPKLRQYVNNKSEISANFRINYNESMSGNCLVKDMRSMCNELHKGSINFLEILFTEYKIINPKYKKYVDELITHRETIARADVWRTLNSSLGMMNNKFKYIQHDIDALAIDSDNNKQLSSILKSYAHITRLNNFIERYSNGELFETCIRVPMEISLIRQTHINETQVVSLLKNASEMITESKEIVNSADVDSNRGNNVFATKLLDDICYYVVSESLSKQLGFTECRVAMMEFDSPGRNNRIYPNPENNDVYKGIPGAFTVLL